MVLQDTWLFEGTVRENLIYCTEKVSDEKMKQACKAVGLDHFIRAAEEDKTWRTITDYGIPESSAAATMKRYNKKRANYYYANTARKWDDYKNYDIILNSSSLGIDGCVAALKGLITA